MNKKCAIFLHFTTAFLLLCFASGQPLDFTTAVHDYAFRQADTVPAVDDLLQSLSTANSLDCTKKCEIVRL